MDKATLRRLRYPFPTLANQHAQAMQHHTEREWIDGECDGFVPQEVAASFKKVRTAYMASYFFPSATWERLAPLARMMLFSLYQDDIYEKASPEQVRQIRLGTLAVARGEQTPAQAGVMLGGQIGALRRELLRFVPPESVDRWADDLDMYFEGLEAETAYVRSGAFPTVKEYISIREKALMLHPFMSLKEVETGVVLPAHVHAHPVVRRLKSLAVRVIGWFNEFQSYDKDMATGMANMNLINVIAHERDINVNEAREHVFGLHAEDLAEFVRLQQNLPDFGEWHDAVANHIHHISFVISGWRGVDTKIQRYDSEFYPDQQQLQASVRSPTTFHHRGRRPGDTTLP